MSQGRGMPSLRDLVAQQRIREHINAAGRSETGWYLVDVSDVFEVVPRDPEWRPHDPQKGEGDDRRDEDRGRTE